MKLLLAFDDVSRGGTSRSALLFARLWKEAGAQVLVFSPRGLHASRAAAAQAMGIDTTRSIEDVRAFAPQLAHVHHAAPSRHTQAWTGRLAGALRSDAVVLTHNVFAQDLGVAFAGSTVVGVLGDWAAAQYRGQNPRSALPVRVVPNPQDFATFHVPTEQERNDARQELGLSDGDRVVLRVGSPTEEKWSAPGYRALVKACEPLPNTRVRLIGAPSSYRSLSHPGVYVQSEPLDDASLLREYRAADVFAHWAERGESFGNVVLEALGSGLPVVYRAVRTRDNTPAEFRGAKAFVYATSTRSWLRSVVTAVRPNGPLQDEFLERYGSVEMQRMLSRVVAASRPGASDLHIAVLDAFADARPLGALELAAVGIRHNVATAALKRRRLQGQA
jgi:hypothetical protein